MFDSLETVRASLAINEVDQNINLSKNIDRMKVDELKIALKTIGKTDLTGIKSVLKARLQDGLQVLMNMSPDEWINMFTTAAYQDQRLADKVVEQNRGIPPYIIGLSVPRLKAELEQFKVKYDPKEKKENLQILLHNYKKQFHL
jgi:hypothetical protein